MTAQAAGLIARPAQISTALEFSLATSDDDSALRSLLRETAVGEGVRLALAREPRIFREAKLIDESIVIARFSRTQELLACISHLPQTLSLQGTSVAVGYLSQGRIKDDALNGYQRAVLIRAGWRFLTRHLGAGMLFDYCSVTTGRVERLVRCLRLPSSVVWADIPMRTYLIDVATVRAPDKQDNLVRCAEGPDLPQLLAYFSKYAQSHDLFPILGMREIGNLDVRNFYIAFRQGQIVGASAYVNRMSERQVFIRGYPGLLGFSRPMINVASFFRVLPFVPPVNQPIRLGFASHCATHEHDVEAFEALLRTLACRARSECLRFLVIGLRLGNPLDRQLRRFQSHCFESTVLLLNSRGSTVPGTLYSPAPEVSIL